MPTPSMTDKPTIWSNGLCQDYSRSLSKWFASRLDARHVLLGVRTPDELEILPPDVGQPYPQRPTCRRGCRCPCRWLKSPKRQTQQSQPAEAGVMLLTKEHDLMGYSSANSKHRRLDKEEKALWTKGVIYQDGQTNELFPAYRRMLHLRKNCRTTP